MIILAVKAAVLIFLGLWLVYRRRRKPFVCIVLHLRYADDTSTFFVQGSNMKKISSFVSHFIITAIALTAAGIAAAVDGTISVASSDPNVLLVTPQGDGTFHVAVVGVGRATLTVTTDADLGDAVREVSQAFEFEVYDGADEADHFDLAITEVVRSDAAATDTTAAGTDSATS